MNWFKKEKKDDYEVNPISFWENFFDGKITFEVVYYDDKKEEFSIKNKNIISYYYLNSVSCENKNVISFNFKYKRIKNVNIKYNNLIFETDFQSTSHSSLCKEEVKYTFELGQGYMMRCCHTYFKEGKIELKFNLSKRIIRL